KTALVPSGWAAHKINQGANTTLRVLIVARHDRRRAPCLDEFAVSNAARVRNGNRPEESSILCRVNNEALIVSKPSRASVSDREYRFLIERGLVVHSPAHADAPDWLCAVASISGISSPGDRRLPISRPTQGTAPNPAGRSACFKAGKAGRPDPSTSRAFLMTYNVPSEGLATRALARLKQQRIDLASYLHLFACICGQNALAYSARCVPHIIKSLIESPARLTAECEREINGELSAERRCYVNSRPADAESFGAAPRRYAI
ncbi:hypothetical protein ACS8Y6_14830, partial [Salinisphaera sp. RV14]|uniref:hypothetical protein n=1 Tax=Salinisphaera sp. RV14 TaxID=3454140 RepID=UPI003F83915E